MSFIIWRQEGAVELHKHERQAATLEGYSEEEMLEFKKHREQAYDDQLNRITEMVLFISILRNLPYFIFIDYFFDNYFIRYY